MSDKVLFMVRRNYFDAIVWGEKRNEVRRATSRWLTVAANQPKEAVFLCGKKVHRRRIISIEVMETAEKALGRKPSPQGLKDIGDGKVVVFNLGHEISKPKAPSMETNA
jgi:hypothetical protein